MGIKKPEYGKIEGMTQHHDTNISHHAADWVTQESVDQRRKGEHWSQTMGHPSSRNDTRSESTIERQKRESERRRQGLNDELSHLRDRYYSRSSFENPFNLAMDSFKQSEFNMLQMQKNMEAIRSMTGGLLTKELQDTQRAFEEAKSIYSREEANLAQAYQHYQSEVGRWKKTIRKQDDIQKEIEKNAADIERAEMAADAVDRRGFLRMSGGPLAPGEFAHPELDELYKQRDLLAEELQWSKRYAYEALREEKDFGDLSKFDATVADPYDLMEYTTVNSGEYMPDQVGISIGPGGVTKLGAIFSGREAPIDLDKLTDDEKSMYNYIYAKQGKKAAKEYLDYIGNDLGFRGRRQAEEEARAYAEEHPIDASIMTVLRSPVKGVAYLGQTADMISGKGLDVNAWYNRQIQADTATRGQVSQDIEKNLEGNWGKVGSFAYNTGLSMADFLVNTAVAGGNPEVALAIMGSGAAADSVIAAKDRGLSDDQAFTLGTVAGLAEIVTEKVSLETLLNPELLADGALKYIGKNMLAEGSEEVASDVINLLADAVVSRDKMEWVQDIEAYKEAHPWVTEGEAQAAVFKDQITQIALDFAGGAASGGVMGAGGAAINEGRLSSLGKEASSKWSEEEYNARLQELIDVGVASGDENAKRAAYKIIDQQAKGKTVSNANIGRSIESSRQALAPKVAEAQQKAREEITAKDKKAVEKAATSEFGNHAAAVAATWIPGQNVETYVASMKLAYTLGQSGATEDSVKANENLRGLSDNQKHIAWRMGAIASEQNAVNENAPKFEVSEKEDGKTFQISTGDSVDIKSISSIENGKMMLETSDGQVDAADISYANQDDAVLYKAVSGLGVDTATANKIVESYRKDSGGMTAGEYAEGLKNTYEMGAKHYPKQDVARGLFSGKLAPDIQTAVYNQAYSQNAPAASPAYTGKIAKGGTVDVSQVKTNKGKWSKIQSASVDHLEKIAEMTGINFVVYESYSRDGERYFVDPTTGKESNAAPNGFFDTKTGKVYIDLHAGNQLQGTMLMTAGHEMTHAIKEGSPKHYEALADIIKGAYEEKNQSFSDAVAAKMADQKISRDLAEEEVIADSMQDILTNGDVAEFMAEVRAKDATLAERIRDWFRKLFDSISKVADLYRGKRADTAEGRFVQDLDGLLDKLRPIFAEGALEAGANLQNRTVSKNETVAENATATLAEAQEIIDNLPEKKKFSGRGKIEKTADLIAVHNLSEEKLNKALNLGGLPMPSIAIIKASHGHDKFSDISIVFGKDTIDPKKNRANEVYSGDAWTPTYPSVEFKVNDSVQKKLNKKYYSMLKSSNYDDMRAMSRYVNEMERELNNAGSEEALLKDIYKDTDMMQIYLADKGIGRVGPIYKEVRTEIAQADKEMYEYLLGKFSQEMLDDTKTMKMRDFYNKYVDDIEVAWSSLAKEVYGFTDEEVENALKAFNARDIINFVVNARNYRAKGPATVTEVYDSDAVISEIKKRTDPKDYKEWVDSLFEGVLEKEGIRNNKDLFTDSGNRRSWDSLHYEHTIDNVVKAMKESGKQGLGLFGGSILGASAQKYKSIADIKKDEYRLSQMSDEEITDARRELARKFHDLAYKIVTNKDSFTASDSAADMMVEAILKNKSATAVKSYLMQEGKGWTKITDDDIAELLDIVGQIRRMPTPYFEAKPRRAVGFDEVAALVVPDNMSQETLDKAKAIGAQIVTYKAGDNQSRTDALNSIEGVKFSKRDSAGNELSPEQQEFFKDSKVRDKEGRLIPMFHGTSRGGFTVFDTYGRFGLFGNGSYFTADKDVAESYTSKGKGQNKEVYSVYLDIKNPIDMDGKADISAWKKAFKTNDLLESNLDNAVTNEDCFRAMVESLIDEDYYKSDAEEAVRDSLESMGYDGITHIGGGRYHKDDGARHRVFIAFAPEQIKSVDNKTPTSDPDIRYSTRDQNLIKQLEKQNEQLREDSTKLRQMLKLQGKVTGGKYVTESSVVAAAKNLRKEAGATMGSAKDLTKLLLNLYNNVFNDKDLSWDTVMSKADEVVDWLEEHTPEKLEPEAQEVLDYLKGKRFKLSDSQKKEASHKMGSMKDFHKAIAGTVIASDSATLTLDELWQTLSHDHPEWFSPEINDKNQPGELVDKLAVLKGMTEMKNPEYAVYEHQDLLRKVYDSFWDATTLVTAADRGQAKVDALKDKLSDARDTVKEKNAEIRQLKKDHDEVMRIVDKSWNAAYKESKKQHKADIRSLEKAHRQEVKEKTGEVAKKYQEARKKNVEGRKKTVMRHKIQKLVDKLNNLLTNPTKEKHIPSKLRVAVADALDIINMEVATPEERKKMFDSHVESYNKQIAEERNAEKREDLIQRRDAYIAGGDRFQAKVDALKKEYDKIRSDSNPAVANAYDPAIAQMISDVADLVENTSLRDMTLDQMEQVYRMYRSLIHTISESDKMHNAEIKANTQEVADQVIMELQHVGGIKEGSFIFLDFLKKYGWQELKPVQFFQILGSKTFEKLFKAVRSGEDKFAVDISEAKKYRAEQAKKYGADKWDNEKLYTFQASRGGRKEFQLNLQQMLSIYAYAKRGEQALDHMEKGGIVLGPDTKHTRKLMGIPLSYRPNGSQAYSIDPITLGEIIGALTPEQKAYADAMQKYLSVDMAEKGNEVSRELYDLDLFGEENYFPLKSAHDWLAQAASSEQLKSEGFQKVKNKGMTKATTPKAGNPIVLSGFDATWANHVDEMSIYHSMVLPLEDFNRVYNYRSSYEDMNARTTQASISDAYGKEPLNYIDQLLRQLNGGVRADPNASLLAKGLSQFKKGAVMASMSVVAQQYSAIFRAMSVIDPKYFANLPPKNHDQMWEELKQWAPVAVIKEMGGFDVATGSATAEYLLEEERTKRQKATDIFSTDSQRRDNALGFLPGYMDEVGWITIWQAAKKQAASENLTGDEMMRRASEIFTDAVVQTQVYDSTLSRSGIMRSKDMLVQMATAFMAEPTVVANMVANAIVQQRRGQKGAVKRTVSSIILSSVANAAFAAMVYAARDDDDDESYMEKYLASLTTETLDSLNPMGYLPILKDIQSLMQGWDVERSDMAVWADLIKSVKQLTSGKVSTWRKVEDFGGSIAKMFGIPLKNIMRDLRAVWNVATNKSGHTTAAGIGYALKSGIPEWAGGGETRQAEQLYNAVVSGDMAHLQRVKGWYNLDEDKINSAMRQQIKQHFMDGDLNQAQAMTMLMDYTKQDNEVYWTVDKWKYEAENGTSEGYSKYHRFLDSIESGNSAETIKEYMAAGVDEKTLRSEVYKEYKVRFIEDGAAGFADLERKLEPVFKTLGLDDKEIDQKFSEWEFFGKHGWDYDDKHELYVSGEITEAELKDAMESMGVNQNKIESTLKYYNFEKSSGYNYGDRKELYFSGDITEAELRNAMAVMGESEAEIDREIKGYNFEKKYGFSWSDRGEAYKSGKISHDQLMNLLRENDPTKDDDYWENEITAYDWEEKYGVDDVSGACVYKYKKYADKELVSEETFIDLYKLKNSKGNAEETIAAIAGMDISNKLKWAYCTALYSPKTVKKYANW